MSDYGTVDEIKEKIRKNTYQTELKDSTRNTLWQHFQAITAVIDGDRRTLPYVQCSKCLHLLSYDSKRGGTSHLWRHADLCAAPASATPSVTSFFKHMSVPLAAKQKISDKCVEFVCKDIRPFEVVSGEGFIRLAESLIMVGVKYGQVPATDVLPHPTTVSRQVSLKAADLKANVVIPDIKSCLNVHVGAVTTDIWTDQYTNNSYITATAHDINDDWKLVNRTLATSEFDSELTHTGVNIRATLGKILTDFAVTVDRVIFVTDRGANMLAALKDDRHLSCCDHMLNTTLTHVFDTKYLEASLPEMHGLIKGCKELVR